MISKIKTNIFQISFEKFGSVVYFLKLGNKNILIDTSSEDNKKELIEELNEFKLSPKKIDIVLLTHNHYDHVGNLDLFENSEVVNFSNLGDLPEEIKVIKTPGHTKDSICFLYEDVLFSGDTLFFNKGRGRTDLPGGSEKEILESIGKLKNIDYAVLCPGHVD